MASVRLATPPPLFISFCHLLRLDDQPAWAGVAGARRFADAIPGNACACQFVPLARTARALVGLGLALALLARSCSACDGRAGAAEFRRRLSVAHAHDDVPRDLGSGRNHETVDLVAAHVRVRLALPVRAATVRLAVDVTLVHVQVLDALGTAREFVPWVPVRNVKQTRLAAQLFLCLWHVFTVGCQ